MCGGDDPQRIPGPAGWCCSAAAACCRSSSGRSAAEDRVDRPDRRAVLAVAVPVPAGRPAPGWSTPHQRRQQRARSARRRRRPGGAAARPSRPSVEGPCTRPRPGTGQHPAPTPHPVPGVADRQQQEPAGSEHEVVPGRPCGSSAAGTHVDGQQRQPASAGCRSEAASTSTANATIPALRPAAVTTPWLASTGGLHLGHLEPGVQAGRPAPAPRPRAGHVPVTAWPRANSSDHGEQQHHRLRRWPPPATIAASCRATIPDTITAITVIRWRRSARPGRRPCGLSVNTASREAKAAAHPGPLV